MIVESVGTTVVWFKRLICLCIGKIATVCVHLSWGLWSSCRAQKQRVSWLSQTHTHKVLNDASDTQTVTRWDWRYDKVEWNFLVIILLLLSHLFVLVSSAHTYLLPLPRSLIHLPTLHKECRISTVTQRPTNELRWERLGSVVGTLLPSLLSLPGNRCCLREGPLAACCLNEHQTKSLTNRWVTRVNVGFSEVYYFSFPHRFFPPIHGWHTALHFVRIEKIKKGWRHREKQNSRSVGTFSCSFFLLPRAFISINSAYTGICAPVALD